MKGADLSTTIAGGEAQGEPAIDGGGGCERGTPFFFSVGLVESIFPSALR